MNNYFKYANYENCISNLMSSIQKYYGIKPSHKTLEVADKILSKKQYKNVIVMVFDGMGKSIIDKHLDGSSFIYKHQIDTMSSVIPCTTAAATISYRSALNPIETGWLGWSLYMKDIDRNVDIFSSRDSQTREPIGFDCGEKYIPYTCVGEQIILQNPDHHYYELWPAFKPNGCKNLRVLYKQLKKLLKKDENKFIYIYWDQPDHDIHDFGTTDKHVYKNLKKIDRFLSKVYKKSKDTVAFISADHGLTDVVPILLHTYYELLATLTRMPSMDARCTSFSVKKGCEKRFVKLFNSYFEGKFILLSKKEALKLKVFGTGNPHEMADSILGDYIAFAIDKYYFSFSLDGNLFKGHHAGLTKEEMIVPLISFDN